MSPTLKRVIKAVLSIAVAALMLYGIDRLLRTFSVAEVVAGFRAVPAGSIAGALALLVLLYGVYVVQELMGARFARFEGVARGRIAVAALVSRSLATLGVGTISGFALRLRVYGAWGLSARDVTTLTLYNESAYVVGLVSSIAVVFSLTDVPEVATAMVTLPGPLLGGAAAAAVAGYVIVSLRRRRPLHIRSFEIPIVRGRLLAGQLILPLLQLGLGGAIVWTCLPADAGLSLPGAIAVSFLATLGGSASQVPGGLGVFEALVLQFVPPPAHAAALAGLLVRRVIVHLVPIAIGAIVLLGLELMRRPAPHGRVWTDTTATALAVLVFATGVMQIVSASVGATYGPLAELGPIAHTLVFAIGFATLFVARGLHLRHDRAWRAAVLLMVARLGLAALAGPDLPALLGSLVILGILIAGRSTCPESRPQADDPIAWATTIGVAVLGLGWLALSADPGSLPRAVAARAGGVIIAAAILAGAAVARARRERRAGS